MKGKLVALLLCLGLASANAVAGWGAWDQASSFRSAVFKRIAEDAEARKFALEHDGKVSYITDLFFSAGSDRIAVSSRADLTKTLVSPEVLRYELQPSVSRFVGDGFGDISFEYRDDKHRVIIDRNPITDEMIATNINPSGLDSANAAVRNAGEQIQLSSTPKKWTNSIDVAAKNITRSQVDVEPTQLEAVSLSNGAILFKYGMGKMSFDTRFGRANLSASGVAVVDSGYRILYFGGMTYEGYLVGADGSVTPISGGRMTHAVNAGFDPSVHPAIIEVMDRIRGGMAKNVDQSPGKPGGSYEMYAEISPVIFMWDVNAQAVAEHRTNIAPLVIYAVATTIDGAITLAVNTVGLVTGNQAMVNFNGPLAWTAEKATNLALTGNANGAGGATYLGDNTGQWVGRAVGVAVTITSMTGEIKMATSTAISTMGGAAGKALANASYDVASDLNTYRSNMQDAVNLLTEATLEFDSPFVRQAAEISTPNSSITKSDDSSATDPLATSGLSVRGVTPDPVVNDIASSDTSSISASFISPYSLSMGRPGQPFDNIYAFASPLISMAAQQAASPSALTTIGLGTDNFISITPITSANRITNPLPGNPLFNFNSFPIGPTVLFGSDYIRANSDILSVALSGALSGLDLVTYSPIVAINNVAGEGVVTYGSDTNSTIWARYAVNRAGLQYTSFGTAVKITIFPADVISGFQEYNVAWADGVSPTQFMPTAGVATYSGSLAGMFDGGVIPWGGLSMSVDFQTGGIAGNFSFNSTIGTLSATVSGNGFSGTAITSSGMNGTTRGHFYDQAAAETSGAINLSGNGNVFVGSFAAKKM